MRNTADALLDRALAEQPLAARRSCGVRAVARRASVVVAAAMLASGCGNVVTEEPTRGGGDGGGAAGTVTMTGVGGEAAAGGGGSGGAPTAGGGGTGGTGGGECTGPSDADMDGDGFTPAQGDCNDCDAMIGPGAAESPTMPAQPGEPPPMPVDEDCDGLFDEVPPSCDANLVNGTTDPLDAARAIDLCDFVEEGSPHGLVSAAWVQPDGSAPPAAQMDAFHLGHGALVDLGPMALPQVGSRMLALSSGTARSGSDPEYKLYFEKNYACDYPPGTPIKGPCPDEDETPGLPNDGVALEVQIQPPVNALGFKYRYRFYTLGWPKDKCLPYDDHFITLMSPAPAGVPLGNIAFDSLGNPLTISWFLPDACACAVGDCLDDPPCLAKQGDLAGSGFDKVYGAATAWLVTAAPVDQGAESFTLRFAIWDALDGFVDSTVLLDGFEWITTPPMSIGGDP